MAGRPFDLLGPSRKVAEGLRNQWLKAVGQPVLVRRVEATEESLYGERTATETSTYETVMLLKWREWLTEYSDNALGEEDVVPLEATALTTDLLNEGDVVEIQGTVPSEATEIKQWRISWVQNKQDFVSHGTRLKLVPNRGETF